MGKVHEIVKPRQMDTTSPNFGLKSPCAHRDASDEIDELRSEVALLRQRQEQHMMRWQAAMKEQRQHCCDLAAVYRQLQELVNGIPDESLGVARKKPLRPSPPDNTLLDEVREVLLDFKNYIERGRIVTNQKLEDMYNGIGEVKRALEEEAQHRKRGEERLRRLEEKQEQLFQLVASAASANDLSTLRTTLTELFKSGQNDLVASSSRQHDGVKERIADCERQFRALQAEREHSERKLESLCHGNLQTTEFSIQQLQRRVETLCQELRAHTAPQNAEKPSAQTYTAYKIDEMLASLEMRMSERVDTTIKQFDMKHVQFVEHMVDSAKKAIEVADNLPKQVNHLQDEVANIQEAIQRHGEALNDQFLQGPLYGAFEEVRGWLRDVEQHTVKRGEFNEAMVNFDEKLASLRREFLIGGSVEHVSDESADDTGAFRQSKLAIIAPP